MRILVTGAAGFIGAALSRRLAREGADVVGIDNVNDYYPRELKFARLEHNGIDAEGTGRSRLFPGLRFVKMSIDDRAAMEDLFASGHFDKVVNLAAQAGVRYSLTNPFSYLQSNLAGFMVVLECCRNFGVGHLVFASSSSVYGASDKVPYSESDMTDSPVSLYAATKKADELMACSYGSLYGIRMTGLRYFTVYGPWGRPDMAPSLFADAIVHGKPLKIFNGGDMVRDFTYIDDIVEGTVRVLELDGILRNSGGYEIYNIGCSSPVGLMDFIAEMEKAFGRTAEKVFLPMQKGDVSMTYADVSKLQRDYGYRPAVGICEGLSRFASWYLSGDNPLLH